MRPWWRFGKLVRIRRDPPRTPSGAVFAGSIPLPIELSIATVIGLVHSERSRSYDTLQNPTPLFGYVETLEM